MIIARIGHVRNPIANPKGRLPREGAAIGARSIEAFGYGRVLAINRCVANHVRIVTAVPKYATHSVRKPSAYLGNVCIGRLLRRDGALVEIFLAVMRKFKRRGAIWHLAGAHSAIFLHIEGRAFIMVAHTIHNVLARKQTLRLEIKGKGLSLANVLTINIV